MNVPSLPGRLRRPLVVVLLVAAAGGVWWHGRASQEPVIGLPTHLALVVPDGIADDDTQVLAWRDAAAEVGVQLVTVTASQLVRDDGVQRDAALILPDQFHRRMNDALLASLVARVRSGALLMLVHDAGVLDMNGRYAPRSRLSVLAGVDYALYDRLATAMLVDQPARIEGRALPLLHIPPGKIVRDDADIPLTSAQPAPKPDEWFGVVGYRYGRLRYPAFVTEGRYDGVPLMRGADDTLLAGLRTVGRGQVLFVNLPLTYLKLRTDSLFMSSFLRYFAQDIGRLPLLSPMRDARGALVMNWHIDSGASLPAMEQLAALGGFEQGPYSVHLTAGPDVDVPGDGQGMDLATNTVMQRWVRRFADRGDEIGSHGGWIHNEFGRLVGTQDVERSQGMIERNSEVVSRVSGQPVREYSAPTGNHPAWITPWLRARGIDAYYFTGDTGMPPTRSYQDGLRGPAGIWAFPVLSFGSDAAFEEARTRHVGESDIEAWLRDVADYCADHRTVRLVYFHPTGIVLFPEAFRHWLEHTAELQRAGTLRWVTMAGYAAFANARAQVVWSLDKTAGRDRIVATHPASLAGMSWLLPTDRYAEPRVVEGAASVTRDGPYWRVVASDGQRLALDLVESLSPASPRRDASLSRWIS